jgi:hypothetical protein
MSNTGHRPGRGRCSVLDFLLECLGTSHKQQWDTWFCEANVEHHPVPGTLLVTHCVVYLAAAPRHLHILRLATSVSPGVGGYSTQWIKHTHHTVHTHHHGLAVVPLPLLQGRAISEERAYRSDIRRLPLSQRLQAL